MKILITGWTGFLGKNFITKYSNKYEFEKIKKPYSLYRHRKDIDIILHLASPTEPEDSEDLYNDILELSKTMLYLSVDIDAKFVYASSEAVYSDSTQYSKYKLKVSELVLCYDNSVIVLPRVYDATRTKGLIHKIKKSLVPLSDYDNIVSFIDLDEGLELINEGIQQTGNIKYRGDRHIKSIEEIKEHYNI